MDKYLGFAFHPDTYAEEYIRFSREGDEDKIFTLAEADIINENLKMAHGHFGEAIYDLCNMIRNIKP
jgi:elongation factor P hydroxylase